MSFWLVVSLMTVLAAATVWWPLYRPARLAASATEMAVYQSQLVEIETDKTMGLIGANEAEAARVEVARRLLAATDAEDRKMSSPKPLPNTFWRHLFAALTLVALPLGSVGLYYELGSPSLATEPTRTEAQSAGQPVETMVARVEAHLQKNPDDGEGWQVLGPVYLRLGRYSDAVSAWSNAVRVLGESSEREANLGEAMVAEANGIVTPEARNAFIRAVALDSKSVSGRYYLGLFAQQDGHPQEAIKIWRDLIATASEGEHWVSDVRQAIARLEQKGSAPEKKGNEVQPDPKGPDAGPSAMIQSMVDRLAARLQQDGSDVEGWVKLVRSYRVLNDTAKASDAEANARQALANSPDKLAKLNASLKELGTASTDAPASSAEQISTSAAPSEHLGGVAAEAMVERLAERLRKSGSDAEGWLMLTRSYLTLGEKEKATAAIEAGRKALAGDAGKLTLFNAGLKRFDIKEQSGR